MARKQLRSLAKNEKKSVVTPVLIEDLRNLIGEARQNVATTVNAGLTLLYWRVGKRMVDEVLGKERAAYGQQIVVSVARQLVQEYGPSFGDKNLRRMMQFAEVFPKEQIVVSLIRQLSWTHFIALLPIKNPLERDFYAELSRVEGWSVSRLRQKIDSMLFQRTALSRKPEKLARKELNAFAPMANGCRTWSFVTPTFWIFSICRTAIASATLETAILRDIEAFLLEMGGGFSFRWASETNGYRRRSPLS